MKTSLDCTPCLIRQAMEAIRLSAPDEETRIMAVRNMLQIAAAMDFSQPPPVLTATIQARLQTLTSCADPYREAKHSFNQLALELLPPLALAVSAASDPFDAALRLAIAGNIIDLGVKTGLTTNDIREAAATALAQPVLGDIAALRQAVAQAQRILFLADNTGEIVFDRVLIEQLPRGRVTVAVRGRPILNDATREDAIMAGLPALAELIDNGSGIPGTLLADCSPDFRRRFAEADLIIAKGQGNFETLNDVKAPLFCLFRVKCAIVAGHCGYPAGSHIVWRSPQS